MEYGLPQSVNIGGEEYAVRYDYRVILDIFEVLNEIDASEAERVHAALQLFYVEPDLLPGYPYYTEAIEKMFAFINGGKAEKPSGKKQQLVAWEKDFQFIVSAVNRVLGYEVRAVPYDKDSNTGGVHWYTFLSGYMEIGDCLFSQIVSIRSKKSRNKKLDKAEQEFYRQNRDLIEIPNKYTTSEMERLSKWL